MLKAARVMAATAAVFAITIISEITAMAADQAAPPSCGGFGGGGGAGGGAGGAEGGGMAGIMLPIALFVLIFYFFIIRPQRKRQKQQDNLIGSIAKGDQVVTIGGFFGTIQEVREDHFVIELTKEVRVRILKSAVATKRVPTQAQSPAYLEDR